MKKKKTLVALLLCVVLCVCVCAMAGCSGQTEQTITLDPLPAPANVTVHYGDIASDSEDDTVSFDAVENAVSYQVYVYAEGEETAMVTSGTETTLPLPAPMDAGTYCVSVIAVGDKQNYANSLGSQAISYEVAGATKLGQVSGITMDFSKVDADNAVYPTISFTGVENASRYLVDVYAADKDGNKQLTSLGYTTRFTVPADQAGGYMIDSTNYGDIMPGYFVISVTACGDGELYQNGDPVEAKVDWTGVECVRPVITLTEQENGGMQLALENYENYAVGTALDVYFYSDEACTNLVTKTTLTYTTSEFFGNITHNNTLSVEVKEPDQAGDGKLAAGTTYYAVASFDPDIYAGDYMSETVAFTCQKAGSGEAANNGGGGFPGGGGGGGGSDWEVKPEETTFDEGAESFALNIGSHEFFHTTASLQETPDDGARYTYVLAKGDPNAPFECAMRLQLMEDGTTVLTVAAAGPISDAKVTGTWSAEGGVITLTW
ncbi:MAG: hypothetical protein ACI4PO_08805 [Faecousia sp.]